METFKKKLLVNKVPCHQLKALITFTDSYLLERPDDNIVDAFKAINEELDRLQELYPWRAGTVKAGLTIRQKWDTGSVLIAYKKPYRMTVPVYEITNY